MNIVLVHGFLGFRRLLGLTYFNGVAKHLREAFPERGIKVLEAGVSPTGRIERRANQLREQVLRALADGRLAPDEEVHIIAHSMGGLDARYCLSPANPDHIADRVASLSTISTPHHGSPAADLLTREGRLGRRLGTGLQTALWLGGGILDLTSPAAERFNEQFPDHPAVRYVSYAARGRDRPPYTALVWWPFYRLIRHHQGPNDGLVSVQSAAWGETPDIPWPADHTDTIGRDMNYAFLARPPFDYLAKYRAIVELVATRR